MSSSAPLSKPNKFKFGGQEQQTEFDLNWYQYKYRNHDPQIGRFFNVDPLAMEYVYNSPYAFAENKLGLGTELEGLELKPHPWLLRQLLSPVIDPFLDKAQEQMEKAELSPEEKKVAGQIRHLPKMYKLSKRNHQGKVGNFARASGLKGNLNGLNDAFRHGLFNSLNTQVLGEELARDLGVAHEDGTVNSPAEREMDLHNNEVGISLGKNNPNASALELATMLLDKLASGEMMTVNSNGEITKSQMTEEYKKEVLDNLQSLDENGNKPENTGIKPLPDKND